MGEASEGIWHGEVCHDLCKQSEASMAHGSTDGATASSENVSFSLSIERKKSSPAINTFLVAAKFSDSDDNNVDQRTRC